MINKKDNSFLGYLVSENEVVNMTQKQFHDLLKTNTDANFHSENIVYISYRTGNTNLISEAENILKKHQDDGCLTFDNSQHRSEVYNKLINLFLPERRKTISECL